MTDTENTTPELFSFEHAGETVTFEKPLSVVRSPKWTRANRRRTETDLIFTIVEELGGDAVTDAIDEMTNDEFEAFTKKLLREMSAAFQ